MRKYRLVSILNEEELEIMREITDEYRKILKEKIIHGKSHINSIGMKFVILSRLEQKAEASLTEPVMGIETTNDGCVIIDTIYKNGERIKSLQLTSMELQLIKQSLQRELTLHTEGTISYKLIERILMELSTT